MNWDWDSKTVLVTGGTGSFGRKFAEVMLGEFPVGKLIVFSRDEYKQYEMRASGFNDPRLRYFIGDVRDVDRLRRAMPDVDVVVHAAALKRVPTCEYNPIEAVMTNVIGARNVIEAALDSGVDRVMAVSTDKAVNPINMYGATKLCAEKLFIQSNSYSGETGTWFSCVRYGNVVGSRGSVIPIFQEQAKTGKVTVTDERMTRFWITLGQGTRFVIRSIEQMHGGEVFIPKVPSVNIMRIVEAVAPDAEVEYMGIRPGEKLQEVLVSAEEARHTLEFEDMFVIQPVHPWWRHENREGGKPLPEGFHYASDTNVEELSSEDLQRMVADLKLTAS